MNGRGLLVAAPFSGSGKTIVTLALVRALAKSGKKVRAAKSGPDYIDAAFHGIASGKPCVTLDAFAMSDARLKSLAATEGLLVVEGTMGLFDGAPPDGRGSAADLARKLSLPVILVVNVASISQSVAPLVSGFASHDPGINVVGLILNNVGSVRHEAALRTALKSTPLPILGCLPRDKTLARPSRHLGLVPACEDPTIDAFIEQAAECLMQHADVAAIEEAATPLPDPEAAPQLAPPGSHVAIASDHAFAFSYPHLEADWRAQGAQLTPFSPLKDEAPDASADAIFLPGGYPELHAQTLARAGKFRMAMKDAASKGKVIYGECGGYMVLGKSLTDGRGIAYPMCGLLDLRTSFASRRLHLGYRHLQPRSGPWEHPLAGHEFHYATTLHAQGTPLFDATDATNAALAQMGLVSGTVSGSFAHVIDRAAIAV